MVRDFVNKYCSCLFKDIDRKKYDEWINNKPRNVRRASIIVIVFNMVCLISMLIFSSALKEKEREEAEARKRKQEKAAAITKAQNTLASSKNQAVNLYGLTGYLDNKQIEACSVAYSAWVSTLEMTREIPYCNNGKVFEACQKALNVQPISDNSAYYENVRGATHCSTMKMSIPKGKYGKTDLTFRIYMYSFAYGKTTKAFAMFGPVYVDVKTEQNMNEDHMPVDIRSMTNVKGFLTQMENVAKQAVQDAYEEAWGNHANEVADILVNQMLLKVIRKKYGTFSNGVFNVMWDASK